MSVRTADINKLSTSLAQAVSGLGAAKRLVAVCPYVNNTLLAFWSDGTAYRLDQDGWSQVDPVPPPPRG